MGRIDDLKQDGVGIGDLASHRIGCGDDAADGRDERLRIALDRVDGGAARRIVGGHDQRGRGVGGVEVGADFLGEAFGALVDSAAAHDLHLRAAIHVAEIVDEFSDLRHACGQRPEEDEQIGALLADELENFIVSHAAAGETDHPAVGFEEIGGDLAAELFRLGVAAEDEGVAAVGRFALEARRDLVGQAAIEAGGEVQAALADAVVAVEGLNPFHGRPDEVGQ